MSGLFGSRTQTTTQETNPYAGLPQWALDYYASDIGRASNVMNRAQSIEEGRLRDPNSIIGISDMERQATQDIQAENRQAQGLLDRAGDTTGWTSKFAREIQQRAPGAVEDGNNEAMRHYGWAANEMRNANDGADRLSGLAEGSVTGANDRADALTMRGINTASRGNRDARGYMDQAEGALGGDRYMSGYTDDVVDTTLTGMDRNAARERMQRGASEAAIGGLGSTRAAVADALSSQLFGMDRAQTEAQLRDQGFRFGTEAGFNESDRFRQLADMSSGMGMSEGGMYMGAADSIGARGAAEGSMYRGLAGDLSGRGFGEADFYRGVGDQYSDMGFGEADMYGTMSRNIREGGLDESAMYTSLAGLGMDQQDTASKYLATLGEANRGVQQKRRDEPKDLLDWRSQLFNSSRQLPATGGGTTTGQQPGPSLASQLLGAASTAAGIWTAVSDERVKDDIELEDGALDKLRDVGSYSYRYMDGVGHTRERTSGLMAQDLERSGITGAVMEREDGVKTVDPYPVLATVVQAVRELDMRTRGLGVA